MNHERVHGGTDAYGIALHDFSTNSNAAGPCPLARRAVLDADPCHYPDPEYTALKAQLADLHEVQPWRVLLAASASEFIQRISTWAYLQGARQVQMPAHSFGEYAHAALARGMMVERRLEDDAWPIQAPTPMLQWACEPASPTGRKDPALPRWQSEAAAMPMPAQVDVQEVTMRICDSAYLPLRLDCHSAQDWLQHSQTLQGACWQLFSPNKALGLTGVRAAYAIAPQVPASARAQIMQLEQMVQQLDALAPAWPVGSHGAAMLQAWTQADVQIWLDDSREQLREWKRQQEALCMRMGWKIKPGSLANYLIARPQVADLRHILAQLRGQGIKLRDCASFGLHGWVRMGVRSPDSQHALQAAWAACTQTPDRDNDDE